MKLAQKQTFVSLTILAALIVIFSVIAIMKASTAPQRTGGYYKPNISVTGEGLTVTTDTIIERDDIDMRNHHHKISGSKRHSDKRGRKEVAKPQPSHPSTSPLDHPL